VSRARGTLTGRITALAVGIALVTGVLAGALAIGLIRSADQRSARHTLSQLADAAQVSIDRSAAGALAQVRAKRVLGVLGVRYGSFGPLGGVSGDPLAVDATRPADLVRLRAGESVSATRTVDGRKVFIEGRATDRIGFVLVQPRSDATAGGSAAIRRTIIAILIGVGVAALVGGLVARRLARPLRRTAAAAHALAQGRRDVTVTAEGPAEVAEVAEAITMLSEALSQSEGRQREFLMSVSHDLRTPLTAITGYAESLAEGVVPAGETAQVGTVMLSEARRLARLVGDLLDLARLDAQDFRIEFGPVELTELARAAAPVWDQRCRAAGVEFLLEIPSVPVPVLTDAARVRQILDGLMENALRVTPTNAPIVLAVRPEPDGRGCAEVRDGGPGLTDADLAVAFERSELYRRYRAQRQVGTGLGLAIVHGLAARLGGTVEAGHAREGGARFTVRLPGLPPR
jgi:two-component system sensor histidine kinase BaeS